MPISRVTQLVGGALVTLALASCSRSTSSSTSSTTALAAPVWTQVGSSTANATGNYGTKGVADASNAPGARYDAVTWTDSSGNLWVFGGTGYGSSEQGILNDLWKYDRQSQTWTWVAGSDSTNAAGVYGTRGTASADNAPGARSGAAGWTDADGNLWLFGGSGLDTDRNYGKLNDLWKFSPDAQEWTWVTGSSSKDDAGDYGTKGTEASTNSPGARQEAVAWVDSNGDFWLFGGDDSRSDLWKFTPSSTMWTWVSGDSTSGVTPPHGTLGVEAANNAPGWRKGAVGWTDQDGNLWLFGGESAGYLSDLWRFNPSTQLWTWMSGSSNLDVGGTYGTRGVVSASSAPGGRESATAWTDSSGNFWLFGGKGFGSSATESGYLNDVWKYDPKGNRWTWMGGSAGLGAETTSGVPGARMSAAGRDYQGRFWLLGGFANSDGDLDSDLWWTNP